MVIPGTPYETVLYRGMVSDDRMELAGLGETAGRLRADRNPAGTVRRGDAPPAAGEPAPRGTPRRCRKSRSRRRCSVAAPPPPPRLTRTRTAPQVALAPPPPPPPVPAAAAAGTAATTAARTKPARHMGRRADGHGFGIDASRQRSRSTATRRACASARKTCRFTKSRKWAPILRSPSSCRARPI